MRRLAQMTPFEAARIEEQHRAPPEQIAIRQLFEMKNDRDGLQFLKGWGDRYTLILSNEAHLLQPRMMLTTWAASDLLRLHDALGRELGRRALP